MNRVPSLAAATLALALSAPTAGAGDLSPVGKWQTSTGESRYEVSYCGPEQTICAKLVWLRADARTAENLAHLNAYVVQGAQQVSANKWSGTILTGTDTVRGKVTLVSPETMQLRGCKLMFCQVVEFNRI